MSYILEALKKSDKERKREEIPGLGTEHSLPPSRRQGRKPSALPRASLLVLLLFCVGGLGWLLFSGEQPVQKSENPATNTELLPAIPVPEPEKAVLITAELKEQINKEVGEAVSRMALSPEQEELAPIPEAPKEQVSSAVEETVSQVELPAGPEELAPIPEDPKEQVSRALEETVTQVVLPAEPEEAMEIPEEPVPPLLKELPADIRDAVPELSFAGHVYAEERRQRLIMINMRIVREGDAVSPDLTLEQIVQDGVILRYNGTVFRVQLF